MQQFITFFVSECTVSANGVRISNTNWNYAHKAFIETEFSSVKTAKNTWLVCQGYYYADEPAKVDGTDIRANDERPEKLLLLIPRNTILLESRRVIF